MKPRSELSAREIEELHLLLARRLGDTSVPTLPQVAMKVVDLVGDERATVADFTKVLQTDQALSGRLIRMTNSAYYAQRQPVTRVDRAMVLLGLDKLKALALGFHLSKALLEADNGFSFRRQWTQSLFRAWFSLRLVSVFDKRLGGEAFLIGLLSDAGVPLMPSLIGEKYYTKVSPTDPPLERYRTEWNNLMFTHVDVAAALCRIWKLPPTLAGPIGDHHRKPGSSAVEAPAALRLQAVAYFAGSMAIDPDVPTEAIKPDPSVAKSLFGMSGSEMRQLLTETEADFAASREVFDSVIDPSLSVEDIIERANAHLNDSVESMITAIADHEVGDVVRQFHAADVSLAITRGEKKDVVVVISDERGQQLTTERIDPSHMTDADIAGSLMITDAEEEDRRAVLDCIRMMAA